MRHPRIYRKKIPLKFKRESTCFRDGYPLARLRLHALPPSQESNERDQLTGLCGELTFSLPLGIALVLGHHAMFDYLLAGKGTPGIAGTDLAIFDVEKDLFGTGSDR